MSPTFPILRVLTPEEPAPLPDTATRVTRALDRGLPEYVQLNADLGVFVIAAIGRADVWHRADPTAVVSSPANGGHPFRLVLRTGGDYAGALPLTVGARRLVPLQGPRRLATAVAVVDWELRAGSVRGPGAYGSRIELAWWDVGGTP